MIRVILFLVLVGLAALGAAWFADRPGDVSITWLGLQIETSVMFAVAVMAAIVVAAVIVWSLIRLAAALAAPLPARAARAAPQSRPSRRSRVA